MALNEENTGKDGLRSFENEMGLPLGLSLAETAGTFCTLQACMKGNLL